MDLAERTVTVRALETGDEFAEPFDQLLFATGSLPLRPDLPGLEAEGIFGLANVEDGIRLSRFLDESGSRRAVMAVCLGEDVEGFDVSDGQVRAVVTGARRLEADVVVLGMGIRSNSDLAAAAGLPLGERRAIAVDRSMRTGVGGVWAAGDCAETFHAGMNVADMIDLDLSYAPPFSPVWDPVLLAARDLARRV